MLIPNLDFGGAQESFVTISNELGEEHNVVNVVFSKKNMTDYSFNSDLISLESEGKADYFSKVIGIVKRVFRLKRIKKKYNIDVSISFLEGANYVNVLSKSNEKTVLSVRGSILHDTNIVGVVGWVRIHLLIPLLYRFSDNIIVLNKNIKLELIQLLKKDRNIDVIYNFYSIDLIRKRYNEEIEPCYSSIKLFDNSLFFHGRLGSEKGVHHLIHVFNEVKKQNKKLSLIIVGDGAEKKRLIDLCSSYGLRTYVHNSKDTSISETYDVAFLGYQKNPIKFLKWSRISLLASSSEGFGNSLAEALGCGKLCLATDCPGAIREILSGNENLLSSETNRRVDAKYGVILPRFGGDSNDKAIELWVSSIVEILNNDELIRKYESISSKRILTFSKASAMLKWQEVVGVS